MRDFKPRLVDRLKGSGARGMTRSEIVRFMQVPSDHLDLALQELLNSFVIVSGEPIKRKLGRPARWFWHKDFAPAADSLLQPSVDATPDPDKPVSIGGTCRRCGRVTSVILGDRALDYCSDECRNDDTPSLAQMVAAAPDARTWARMARLIVLLDLTVRGYQTASDTFEAGAGPILVYDRTGAVVFLTVIPVSQTGHFPPLDTYNSVALVLRDGRVQYAGVNPLIKPETKDDTSVTEEAE